MKKIIISSDSTCDLSKELIEKYDIKIVPMIINLGTEEYLDGVTISPDDIYNYFNTTGQLAKTSAISYQDYYDWFKKCTDEGYSVIHFCISSDMSATYNNCRMAAKNFDNCYSIDSRNLSTGIGQLVIEACIKNDGNTKVEEIVEYIEEIKQKLNVSFVIDTLKYLQKGGRCSALAALGANMLQLKPCIDVKNGKMDVTKKYRGKMSVCLENYVVDRLANRDDLKLDRIFVTHSGCSEEIINQVVEKVKELQPFKEILVTRAGGTVSTHCGPNTLGVLFFTK